MNNKHVLVITYIGKKNGETIVFGKVLKNSCKVDLYPCDSRNLGIHVGDKWSEIEINPISKINDKAMQLQLQKYILYNPHSTH